MIAKGISKKSTKTEMFSLDSNSKHVIILLSEIEMTVGKL